MIGIEIDLGIGRDGDFDRAQHFGLLARPGDADCELPPRKVRFDQHRLSEPFEQGRDRLFQPFTVPISSNRQ